MRVAIAAFHRMCNCQCIRHNDAQLPMQSSHRIGAHHPPPTPAGRGGRAFKASRGLGEGFRPPNKFGGPHPPTLERRAHVRHVCSVQANLRQQGLPLLGPCRAPAEGALRCTLKTAAQSVKTATEQSPFDGDLQGPTKGALTKLLPLLGALQDPKERVVQKPSELEAPHEPPKEAQRTNRRGDPRTSARTLATAQRPQRTF